MKIHRILQNVSASFDPFHRSLGLPFRLRVWSYFSDNYTPSRGGPQLIIVPAG